MAAAVVPAVALVAIAVGVYVYNKRRHVEERMARLMGPSETSGSGRNTPESLSILTAS